MNNPIPGKYTAESAKLEIRRWIKKYHIPPVKILFRPIMHVFRIFDNSFDNTFTKQFSSCIVGNNFRRIVSDANITTTDFTSATIVYGDYSKSIITRTDGSIRISTLNNSNTIIYSTLTT